MRVKGRGIHICWAFRLGDCKLSQFKEHNSHTLLNVVSDTSNSCSVSWCMVQVACYLVTWRLLQTNV